MIRTPSLLVALLACSSAIRINAQITAGVVPVGYTMSTYNIHLEPLIDFTEDSADFDVDCDGINDFRLFLDRNFPAIDAANHLFLRSLADSVRICADDMGTLCPAWNYANLHTAGTLLNCPAPFALLADTNVMVGDYVTFTCGGIAPPDADSVYVHYEKTTNGAVAEGWILLSFNIMSTDVIDPWAEVHAAIGACGNTGIGAHEAVVPITVLPGTTGSGVFTWSATTPVTSVLVCDAIGQVVSAHAGGTAGLCELRGSAGLYLIKFMLANGRSHVARVWRD